MFDNIKTINELADFFDGVGSSSSTETKEGILIQYQEAIRNNSESAAMVMYMDRTDEESGLIQIKSMWFDEEGNRVKRPVRETNGE